MSDRTRLPLATRRRRLPTEARRRTLTTGRHQPLVIQAHREREQAQGTLGTADHDTRAPETGQSRVPHMHGHGPAIARRGGRHPGQRRLVRFSSRTPHRVPGAPGSAADGTRRRAPTAHSSRATRGPRSGRTVRGPALPSSSPRSACPRRPSACTPTPPASSRPASSSACPTAAAAADGTRRALALGRGGPDPGRGGRAAGGRAAAARVRPRAAARPGRRGGGRRATSGCIGPVRALSSPAPGGHCGAGCARCVPVSPWRIPRSRAGTLGGFVQTAAGLSILSNNHVLAASDAAVLGDAVLQPGPADGGGAADRVGTLSAFQPLPDRTCRTWSTPPSPSSTPASPPSPATCPAVR